MTGAGGEIRCGNRRYCKALIGKRRGERGEIILCLWGRGGVRATPPLDVLCRSCGTWTTVPVEEGETPPGSGSPGVPAGQE